MTRSRLHAVTAAASVLLLAPSLSAVAPQAGARQSRTAVVREERDAARASAAAPRECLTAARAFIAYVLRESPDIAGDEGAQKRWLSDALRKALAHRQEVYREYAKQNPDSPEGPPGNGDFVGSWDNPTGYAVTGSRRYGERAVVDVLFKWGAKTNYPDDSRLVSYVFVREGKAWKLDDIYTFRGEYVSASSLSATFLKETYP